MILWLWDAPGDARTGRGVSGDEAAARRAAAEFLLAGDATAARVEAAMPALTTSALSHAYQRFGYGWQATCGSGGKVRWRRFRDSQGS